MSANTANTNKDEKILVIFGSPRKSGFTAMLLKLFLEQYLAALHNAADISYCYPYEQSFLPCVGCGGCDNGLPCVRNKEDGYDALLSSIQTANTVILAAPVYFGGFPAPVKALIDRTQQLYQKRKAENSPENGKTKKGFLLLTCGSQNKENLDSPKRAAKYFFQLIDAGFAGRLFAVNTDKPEQIEIFS